MSEWQMHVPFRALAHDSNISPVLSPSQTRKEFIEPMPWSYNQLRRYRRRWRLIATALLGALLLHLTAGIIPPAISASSLASTVFPATATPTLASRTISFNPVADAYVSSDYPDQNYGGNTVLLVDAKPVNEAFLTFELSGLTGPVVSVKLRVYVVNPSVTAKSVARMSQTNWSESTVTYRTRPMIDGSILSTLHSMDDGRWSEFDVTPAVTGNGTISLGLRSTDGDGMDFSSRESTNPPQLIVNLGTSTTSTATPVATSTSTPKASITASPTSSTTASPTSTAVPTITRTANAAGTETATATLASVPSLLHEPFDGSLQGNATNVSFDTLDKVGGSGSATFGASSLPSYVVATNVSNRSSITYDFWFRPATTVSGALYTSQGLAGFTGSTDPNSSGASWDKALYLDTDGSLVWYVYASGKYSVRSTTRTWRADRWYHVTASIGPSGLRLYVDNNLEAANAAVTESQVASPSYLSLGRGPDSGGLRRQFFGKLDEFRLYGGEQPPNTASQPVTVSTATRVGTASPATSPTATQTPAPTATHTPTPAAMATHTPTAARTIAPTATGNTADVLTPTKLNLNSTFNSIGIELFFGGDANGNGTAALEFKQAADAEWRQGLPLWRTTSNDATGSTFYGSALLLEPDSVYDVRITLADPDQISGSSVITGTIRTRAEDIVPASAIVPTHYVRATGSDSSSGTSETQAWRTLEKAITSAPAGAIVQVGPGYFKAPTKSRTLPITLLAQYPAVDYQRNAINSGRRTVIEPSAVSSPAGSGGPNAGVWQRVTLAGPGYTGAPAGAKYTVWKWAGSPLTMAGGSGSAQLGYAGTREGSPQRVATWKRTGSELQTAAGWTEKLYTNKTYNYGFYTDGTGDIYVRLPGDQNPNDFYITAGDQSGFTVDGPHFRLSGFELRQFMSGIDLRPGSSFAVIDHNLLTGNLSGVRLTSGKGMPTIYGTNHVIQFNRIENQSLWTDDHTHNPSIPWNFVKGAFVNADGSSYAGGRVGDLNEASGVGGAGGARQVTIRNNTISGSLDGVSIYVHEADRYSGADFDIHDNHFHRLADDGLDPSKTTINWRVWGNRFDHTVTALSIDPLLYGPIYFFRNEVWRTGNYGSTPDNQGSGAGTTVFKYSGNSTPLGRVYVLHNTIWTDQGQWNTVSGGARYASGSSASEAFYLRNNVFRASRYAFDVEDGNGWNEDYNHFSTTDTTRGVRYRDKVFTTNVQSYRLASGQGEHTNMSGDFITPPQLSSPSTGDLNLAAGSPLIDAGVQVPNISDRPGTNYAGAAPDLGARERS